MLSGSGRGIDTLKVVARVAGLTLGLSWLRLDHECLRAISGNRFCYDHTILESDPHRLKYRDVL